MVSRNLYSGFFRNLSRNIQPSEDVIEQRILLEKKWSLFKQQQHLADIQLLDKIAYAQQKALDQLKMASEELYEAAIQVIYQLVGDFISILMFLISD